MNEQAAPAPSQSYVHTIRMGANMILKGHQTANLSLRLTTNTMLSAHTHTHTHTHISRRADTHAIRIPTTGLC